MNMKSMQSAAIKTKMLSGFDTTESEIGCMKTWQTKM